jgi:2-polyprenyl-3-methyl-5-hydroxy-6-metoxy-1,4-benzoquinol methylase
MSAIISSREWTRRVVASLKRDEKSPHGDPLPEFPDAALQLSTTGLSGREAIEKAAAFHQDVCSVLEGCGASLRPGQRLLDFGCGWGRIARMFMRDVSAQDIHGIDVDPEFIALCRELFLSDNFSVCPPIPDGSLRAESFDLIVSYSVFSHLSEAATRAWLDAFHRALKPRAFVAFTTRHESFFSYLDWARTADGIDPYTRALGTLFTDTSVPRQALRRGEFVHATGRGVSGGGVRNDSFYGETWIPAAYLERTFAERFDLVATRFDAQRYDQVTYVMRKA